MRQPRNSHVLDSSALLALILLEPGAEAVTDAVLSGAVISSVNLSEVVTRLLDIGFTEADAVEAAEGTDIEVRAFTTEHALAAANLREQTRRFGLGLGDRACLALAAFLGLPALTADRIWSQVDVGVEVALCR